MFLEPCNFCAPAGWMGSFPRGCILVFPEKPDRNKGRVDAEHEGLRRGVEMRKEDEKEDFNLLGVLAPERCCKCWSWWGKEGRAQRKKSGLSLAPCCSHSPGSWWVPAIVTLMEWYAEECSHCSQCSFFHLTNFLFFKFSCLWTWFWWKCYLFGGEVAGGSAKCRVWSYGRTTWHACVTSPPPSSPCCTCRSWTSPSPPAGFWSVISCPVSPSTSSWLVTLLSCQHLIRLFLSSPLGSSVISFQLLARQRVISSAIWPSSCQKNKWETGHT